MEAPVSSILAFSIRSRVVVIVVQFVSNLILPDHDAGVFNPPVNTSSFKLLDSAVHLILGGFRRWDAVYFTHIMQHGYSYENCVAFFPLFPWLASSIASILLPLRILHFSSCVLLVSVILNIVLFSFTSVGLYKLGKTVLKDEPVAYYGALFFCFNPASIFMTAPYSEILYFSTLVYALIGLNAGAKYASSFLIGLGVFTRSNGLIGTGFVLHRIARSYVASVYHLYNAHQRSFNASFIQKVTVLTSKTLLEVLVCTILCILPFFIFQYFVFQKFCQSARDFMDPSIAAYGRQQGYHLQGDKASDWCYNMIPLSYSYIQQHHWGVGFLQYYTLKQVPNFLLALPIICLSLRACYYFLNLDRKASFYLGLWDFRSLSLHRALMYKKVNSFEYEEETESAMSSFKDCLGSRKKEGSKNRNDVDVPRSLQQLPSASDTVVFALHLLSLVIFGLLYVHIQVVTRLLCSSSPLLYWYCGTLFASQYGKYSGSRNRPPALSTNRLVNLTVGILNKFNLSFISDIFTLWPHIDGVELKLITTYFLVYFVVGTVMFSNFLPWT